MTRTPDQSDSLTFAIAGHILKATPGIRLNVASPYDEAVRWSLRRFALSNYIWGLGQIISGKGQTTGL